MVMNVKQCFPEHTQLREHHPDAQTFWLILVSHLAMLLSRYKTLTPVRKKNLLEVTQLASGMAWAGTQDPSFCLSCLVGRASDYISWA